MVKRIIFWGLTILISLIGLFWIGFNFLGYSKKVDAQITVIEGWLPKTELESVYSIFKENPPKKIVICGMSYPKSYIRINDFLHNYSEEVERVTNEINKLVLVTNGAFLFHFGNKVAFDMPIEIEFSAQGGKNLDYYSHINIVINDSLITDYFVPDSMITLSITCPFDSLENLVIDFNNDSRCNKGSDRNIIISDLQISGIPINQTDFDAYKATPYNVGYYPRSISSEAEDAKNYLTQLGLEINSLEVVNSNFTKSNKTLSNAKALSEYVKKHYPNTARINIITSSTHSRRSYVNYKNAMQGIDIGIIPISGFYPGCYESKKPGKNLLHFFNEAASLAYTYGYWLFK